MRHPTKTCWIVVADEEKALLLENRGTATSPVLHLVQRIDSAEVLAAHDRSARSRDHSQDTNRPQDYHRMAGGTLAHAVADQLERARVDQAFGQVVLVAPPQVLGALRAALGEPLRAAVLAELPKTLTGHTLAQIAEAVLPVLSKP